MRLTRAERRTKIDQLMAEQRRMIDEGSEHKHASLNNTPNTREYLLEWEDCPTCLERWGWLNEDAESWRNPRDEDF